MGFFLTVMWCRPGVGGEVGQHNVCEFESVQHDCQLLWILSVTMCTGQSCFLPFKGSRLNYNVH